MLANGENSGNGVCTSFGAVTSSNPGYKEIFLRIAYFDIIHGYSFSTPMPGTLKPYGNII